MNAQEKAKEIFEGHLNYFGINRDEVEEEKAKNSSIFTVNMIIDALLVTTGHLDLNQLDSHEVGKDFEFWKEVRKQLQS